MTDEEIVAYLRKVAEYSGPDDYCNLAANAIERLTKERDKARRGQIKALCMLINELHGDTLEKLAD